MLDYRGELMAVMKATTDAVPAIYKPNERFCQLVIVPVPEIEVVEAEELSKTERGDGAYGSTGTENPQDNSAAAGSQEEASEQPETAPEPAADSTNGSEVSE